MDFKAPYNRNDYIDFFRNHLLPEDFHDHSEDIAVGFKSNLITKVVKIGEVSSLELIICEVSHPSENDPRVSLSRDAFRLLAQYGAKRALIIFNSENSQNFRLSLVTIDLKWEEGKRVEKEYSNPRRYSFFLGPETKVHTPQEYLIKQGRVKDFDDLKERFSIEVVNKEFYTQIAVLFTQLAGGKREIGRKSIDAGRGLLNLPSTVDDTMDKEFTVRLIGRLVFCWFLKKKRSDKNIPLLPEELLSAKAVSENKGYYHGILEPLFFEVLNTPTDNRAKKYQCSPWSQIPFLNGGLFTPHLHDYYEPGLLGISKHINTLKVPDHWIKELFEVFETYNFTIDENTSIDVELSIEPEMLGRIFENLLAEINPETGETARKATGSYYTPRPIVEYMVDESLKQYLLTKTKLEEDKITRLLTYEDIEVKLTGSEKESVLNALDSIKIIDPACGSGAFPMGILQKMLLILQKVDPESEWWLDTKLSQIESKLLKKELGKKLKDENVNYVHKLGIIQSSIYGVDIQPIAVEISKLRFFLSLIVDETVNDAKENRGIEPLPNLEFKFVCSNSLIGLPKKEPQQTLFEAADDIKALRDLRDDYLRSYGDEKKKIEKKFQEVQSRMFKHGIGWGGKDSQTLKLAQWNPFSEEPCSWFDPDWMFGVKDGFDIAIANPPYIDSESMVKGGQKELREVIQENYTMTKGNWDIYIAFYELGFNLWNENGVLTFITPDKWISKPFGDALRKGTISYIFSILKAGRTVFESSNVDSIISVFIKKQSALLHIYSFENNRIQYNKSLDKKILRPPFALDHLFSDYLKLLIKIESIHGKFSDYGKCEGACATSDAYKLKPFLAEASKDFNPDRQLKIINTGTISKYFSRWGISKMTYLNSVYQRPVVNKKIFLEEFKNSYGEKSIKPKLIIKGLNLLDACLDLEGYIIPGKSTLIVTSENKKALKFLLAIINSKLASFFIKERYPASSYNLGTNFTPDMINNLPLPEVTISAQLPFIKVVDAILIRAKSAKVNVSFEHNKLERQLDQMVYDLYGLTKKEIEIVEQFGKK